MAEPVSWAADRNSWTGRYLADMLERHEARRRERVRKLKVSA